LTFITLTTSASKIFSEETYLTEINERDENVYLCLTIPET